MALERPTPRMYLLHTFPANRNTLLLTQITPHVIGVDFSSFTCFVLTYRGTTGRKCPLLQPGGGDDGGDDGGDGGDGGDDGGDIIKNPHDDIFQIHYSVSFFTFMSRDSSASASSGLFSA